MVSPNPDHYIDVEIVYGDGTYFTTSDGSNMYDVWWVKNGINLDKATKRLKANVPTIIEVLDIIGKNIKQIPGASLKTAPSTGPKKATSGTAKRPTKSMAKPVTKAVKKK